MTIPSTPSTSTLSSTTSTTNNQQTTLNGTNVILNERLYYFAKNVDKELTEKLEGFEEEGGGKIIKLHTRTKVLTEGTLGLGGFLSSWFAGAGGTGAAPGRELAQKGAPLLRGIDSHKKKAVDVTIKQKEMSRGVKLRKEIIKFAFILFQAYENPFMKMDEATWLQNINTLITDIAKRVTTGINLMTVDPDNQTNYLEFLIKSFLLGENNSYTQSATHFFKKVIKIDQLNFRVLNGDLGVVCKKSNELIYFSVKGNTTKLGYRFLLPGEEAPTLTYVPNQPEHNFILNQLDEETKEIKISEITARVNAKDVNTAQERLVNIEEQVEAHTETLEDINEQMQETSEKIDKIDKNITDIKETQEKNTFSNADIIHHFSKGIDRVEKKVTENSEDVKKTVINESQALSKQLDFISTHVVGIHEKIDKTNRNRPFKSGANPNCKNYVFAYSEQMEEVNRLLHLKDAPAKIMRTVAVCGKPGSGTTEMAKKFIVEYGAQFSNNVIVFDVTNEEKINKSYRDVADSLKVDRKSEDGSEDFDRKDVIANIYKCFESEQLLVILDGAKNYKMIADFLHNPNENLYIVITSRFRNWNVGSEGLIRIVELNEFNAGVELLKKSVEVVVKEEDEDDVKEIVEMLELPLTIQQAGSFMNSRNNIKRGDFFSFKEFLEVLKNNGRGVLDWNVDAKAQVNSKYYTKTVWSVFDEIFDDMIVEDEENGRKARELLEVISYLRLSNYDEVFGDGLEDCDCYCDEAEEMLEWFCLLSEVNVEGEVRRGVSKLVQWIMRLKMDEEKILKLREKALDVVCALDNSTGIKQKIVLLEFLFNGGGENNIGEIMVRYNERDREKTDDVNSKNVGISENIRTKLLEIPFSEFITTSDFGARTKQLLMLIKEKDCDLFEKILEANPNLEFLE